MKERSQAYRFLGREDDLEAVLSLLKTGDLVTITGCGGIGKSALAREILGRLDAASATWIDLSTITDGAEAVSLVVRSLRIGEHSTRSPIEQLCRYLSTRAHTLLLDNCEHVICAAADLTARLLASCPMLRIVATSTTCMGLTEEQIYDLPPLDLPTPAHSLKEAQETECVQFLLRRLRMTSPLFEVTEDNLQEVVTLCGQLDGLPLAIELAAIRLRVISVAQLVRRLKDRFGVLGAGDNSRPARHQTLRALMEWSLERCTEDEALLWARLSVLPGPFALETAEAVCATGTIAPDRILDLISRLVAHSLLVVERGGPHVVYRQLATIRDFGAELLDIRGEAREIRRRLLRYRLDITRERVRGWSGPNQALALMEWRAEHVSTLGVVDWAAETGEMRDEAAELVALLRYHWIASGQLSDGRRWLDRALGFPDLTPRRRGEVAAVAAWVALIQGDRTAADGYLAVAGQIVSVTGDAELAAHTDLWHGLLHLFSGRLAEAIDHYQRAIPALEASDTPDLALTARYQMAMAQVFNGDPAAARAACQDVLNVSGMTGELWNRAYALWVLSLCAWRENKLEEAERIGREALTIHRRFEDGICIALELLVLCWVADQLEEDARAQRLAQAAAAVWDLIGTDVSAFGPHLAAAYLRLTPVRRAGSVPPPPRSKAEAVAEGLSLAPPRSLAPDLGLTRREGQILTLLELGRTNRAIAETLGVSTRTAEGHVANILSKLGVNSRSAVISRRANTPRP